MALESTPLRVFDFRRLPTASNGNIAFSRDSEASYYGSDGYLHFTDTGNARLVAGPALVPNPWNKVGATIATPDNILDPEGTKTATKLTETDTKGEHRMSQSVTVVKGTPITISIYVKAGTRSKVQFSFQNAASYTGGNPGAKFDVSTGKFISASSNAVDYKAIDSGDGWWQLSLTGLPDLGTASGMHLYILNDGNNSISYQGTTDKYLYTWGAQFEEVLLNEPAAIVTNNTNLRYNHDLSLATPKVIGALIEPAATNLVPYSQLLTHAVWRKQYSTLITTGEKAPDGTITAFKLKEDTSKSTQHYLVPNPTISSLTGTEYTFSAFLKAAERKWAFFNINGVTVHFDLVNGVVGNFHNIYTSTSVENAGNGWFRCSATYTSNVTSTSAKIGPEPSNGTPTYNGDGNSGILVWGAQFEKGSKMTSYIRTQSSPASRSADFVTLAKPAGSGNDVFVQRLNGGEWLNDLTSSYQVALAESEVQLVNYYSSSETIESKNAIAESLFPSEYQTINNNATLTTNGILYVAQTPNKSWSFQQATNKTAPIFRFELRSGDTWTGDTTASKKKERTEVHTKNGGLPFNQDVWISFSMRIATGPALNLTPSDYCLLGQIHATEDPGEPSVGPILGFRLEGADTIKVYTSSSLDNPHTGSVSAVPRASSVYTRGQWHSTVMRMRFSTTNGQLQWWQNGNEILNLSGIGLAFPDKNGPYWKFGIYRIAMTPTITVEFANMEIVSSSSLLSRVTNPLTIC